MRRPSCAAHRVWTRWDGVSCRGDTYFITVIGAIRIIPDSLEAMAEQYREQVAATNDLKGLNPDALKD